MLKIEGYQIFTQIYESANSKVYRGIRQQDNKSVILKMLKQDYPTLAELTRYRQEYEITRHLNLEGVVKAYGLEEYQRTIVIILEDFGGNALKMAINTPGGKQGVTSLAKFLHIAIQTAEILGKIHAANVIHKDINPANIVLHPETGQVKIIDFGISTVLTRENPTLKSPNVLEGTLAYISPEQTGRMNRALDYRTDFYSLGATLYELLTGRLPFETEDALEVVHCHIAKLPVPPCQVKPVQGNGIKEIPQAISDIVMKLMAKTAEERYQSAFGLKADLEQCLKQLETTGKIALFSLGTQDISDKFQIPQKLYGREREIQTLLAAFERISTSNSPTTNNQQPTTNNKIEMMLVAGYSGIGKSALVQEIYKPITRDRGYFIGGKFEQLQRNIPYSAVVAAFAGLVRQLLTETEDRLTLWRNKLLAALGANSQVIIDVIPEVELIVGKQPAVPQLGSTESQNRFNLVFSNFIRVFCAQEHPLVIFLDDLQWADSATLKLIELMMTDTDTEYLFLISAYRDNEVSPSHPLIVTLEGLRQTGATINQITLSPLALHHVNQLIADTLYANTESVKPLAELVVRKTGGNPFFVNEFLKTLYQENLLSFNVDRLSWQWEIDQIEAIGITDNVVDLMIGKLKKLPPATQSVLRFAACLGAEFDLKTLSLMYEEAAIAIFSDLKVAIQAELILALSELDENLLIQEYKFGHDRIQQAAYALIAESEKPAIHLQIGRLLLENTTPEALSEKIFAIADHLNLSLTLVTHPEEPEKLAELNLLAGRKATLATAYGAAVQYLKTGIDLLPADAWQSHYELTRALYESAAEAAYLNGNVEQMEQLVAVVLQQAKTQLDKVKVYEVKIQACIAHTQLQAAVKMVLQAISLLGITISENPSQSDIQQALSEIQSKLTGKKILDLIDLPLMRDPAILAVMRLLGSANAAAYTGTPELLPLIVATQVNLSVEYGNADVSPLTYAYYGAILCGTPASIEAGYQFGQVALSLLERFDDGQIKARTCDMVYGMIQGWKVHLNKTLKPLQNNYQIGRDYGTFDYAGYSILKHSYYALLTGQPLAELEQKLATYAHALAELKQFTAVNYLQRDRQAVLNLIEETAQPGILTGKIHNESEKLPLYHQAGDAYGLLYFYLDKLILSYLFQDLLEALKSADRAEKYLDGGTGLALVAAFHFYDSLTRLMAYSQATSSEQAEILSKVKTNQEKMALWAHHAPMNYRHKFYLVEAERYRVLGEDTSAMDFYDRAIAAAHKYHYINEEALACELAAKFWLAKDKERFAKSYLNDAYYAYTRWGATAKVKDLEARYPQLLTKSATTTRLTTTHTTTISTTTSTSSVAALDFATVIKASQTIGSQIVLEQLLRNLMKILIENAGAQVGYLILPSQGQWIIEAEGAVDTEEVTVLQSVAIAKSRSVSSTLINYVARTKESVVLNDATREGNFTNDPYIIQNQPKSILCFPLSDRGQLVSIVYLENNLITGAFTPDRLEVLKILSAQAAISIENARLYQTLEDKVAERTTQLARANEEITALNERLKQENLRMSAELEVTQQLQQMILPKESELESIQELEIAGFMEPADEVGGDYYDVLRQNGRIKIGIGDVTGHGLESGMLMLMAQTAVRTLLESNQTDPVQFLDILNRTLYGNLQRMDSYKNMTLALLDYADGVLSLSGQHEEMLVVRAGGEVERIDTVELGFPIGLEEQIVDFIASEQVHLNRGDGVVLYTDGITEAENINHEQYGLDRLAETVSRNWEKSARDIRQAVIEDVQQFIGTQKVFDDITLVVIKQK
ncbi:MAG TPA: serine/threonine-protein kinase PknK [Cyanobacteria bacterium UBA8803]|nr:serine/threonine-protein kinase PknK [Cyanobacteria bacterium UBA9273]HBL58380.1 serine/threonine-protein kinase PknK [Cyanobacteria bacterium UBA8803]